MTQAAKIAWKVAIAGAALGVFLELRDNLAVWRSMPDLDMSAAIARVVGASIAGAVLGWLGGYAYGIRIRHNGGSR